jgi:hypothetical protein
MKVFVYYNLHTSKWSIKALEGEHKGLVIGHASIVKLDNVSPKVSQKGRERVLKTKRKNVHAGLVGDLSGVSCVRWIKGVSYCAVDAWPKDGKELIEGLHKSRGVITYNPYKYESFVSATDERAFLSAEYVIMWSDRTVVATNGKFKETSND